MTELPVSEVLNLAADRIERGWCRHTMATSDGRVCSLGGIGDALGLFATVDDYRRITRALAEYLGLYSLGDNPNHAVIEWNDYEVKCAAEVVAAFRAAALVEAAKENPTVEPEEPAKVALAEFVASI